MTSNSNPPAQASLSQLSDELKSIVITVLRLHTRYLNELDSNRLSEWATKTDLQLLAAGEWSAYILALWGQALTNQETTPSADQHSAPLELFEQCQRLTAQASDLLAEMTRRRTDLHNGKAFETNNLERLPPMVINQTNETAIWQFFESLLLEEQIVESRLRERGIPRRMQSLFDRLSDRVARQTELIQNLQGQWLATAEIERRAAVSREAMVIARELFQIGQILWAPQLLTDEMKRRLQWSSNDDNALLGFDRWALTDRSVLVQKQNNPESEQELAKFWNTVDNLDEVPRIIEFLNVQKVRRRIRNRSIGPMDYTPWPPQYMVRFPVSYGGRKFSQGDILIVFVKPVSTGHNRLEVRKSGRLTILAEYLGIE